MTLIWYFTLTSLIFECCKVLLTTWTTPFFLLVLIEDDTVSTENLATASIPVLLRVSGHTETDQTEKLIRRTSHPLTVIATNTLIGCHCAKYVTDTCEALFESHDYCRPMCASLIGLHTMAALCVLIVNKTLQVVWHEYEADK